MTAATKISFCVDCATPIIGARLRCSACHDWHTVTVSVPRSTRSLSGREELVAWLGAALIVVVIVILLVVAGRSCS
jgi:hypothetical protein